MVSKTRPSPKKPGNPSRSIKRVPLSGRLNEFRKRSSPSKRHAKEIAQAGDMFFRKREEITRLPPNPTDSGAGSLAHLPGRGDAATESLLRYYADTLFPIEREMAKKGVFAHFEPILNAVISGDIIRQSRIRGCTAIFVANTKVESRGEDGEQQMFSSRYALVAAYVPAVPPVPQRILVFADNAEKRLLKRFESAEKAPIYFLNGGTPLTMKTAKYYVDKGYEGLIKLGFTPQKASSTLVEILFQNALIGEERGKLLDKYVFDSLMHEAGHMLLRRFVPQGTPIKMAEEFFAYSSALSFSKAIRLCLAELANHAASHLSGTREAHADAASLFLGTFNGRLGMEGRLDVRSLVSAMPRYMCAHEELRTTSLGMLQRLCSEIGKERGLFLERAAKDAEKAVFG